MPRGPVVPLVLKWYFAKNGGKQVNESVRNSVTGIRRDILPSLGTLTV